MSPKRTTAAQAAQAEYQLSDDEDDELLLDDVEDSKPSSVETSQILKGQLQEPRYKTVNLRQLHGECLRVCHPCHALTPLPDLIHSDNVDLDPDYQRDVVWSKDKQSGLIESLFLNYYVPPVIFAVTVDEETGEEKRVCIDGKQRCTSVVSFYDGKIPFKTASGHRLWYTAPGVRGGQVLSQALKRKFDQISLQVVEYPNPTMAEQRDIFQRVQLGVPLSSAERLQALGGEMPAWIRDLDTRFIGDKDNLAGFHGCLPQFDTKRAKAFQILTAFVQMAFDGEKRTVPTAKSEEKFLSSGYVPERHFKWKIESALAILLHIAQNYNQQSFGVAEQRVAPVEFWFAALLVFRRMNVLSTAELAEEIGSMRRFIRDKWVDIRANTSIHRDLYEFLENVPNRRSGGGRAAIEEHPELTATMSKKRLREEEEDGTYLDASSSHKHSRTSDVVNGLRSR